ncbi:unnamed protein product [Lampetra fluviatilis]
MSSDASFVEPGDGTAICDDATCPTLRELDNPTCSVIRRLRLDYGCHFGELSWASCTGRPLLASIGSEFTSAVSAANGKEAPLASPPRAEIPSAACLAGPASRRRLEKRTHELRLKKGRPVLVSGLPSSAAVTSQGRPRSLRDEESAAYDSCDCSFSFVPSPCGKEAKCGRALPVPIPLLQSWIFAEVGGQEDVAAGVVLAAVAPFVLSRARQAVQAHAGAPQRAETQKRREVNNAQRSSREFTRDADCGQSEGLPRHGVRGVTGCPSRGLPPAVSLALLAVANGAILPSPFLWPRNGRACCNKLCPPPPRASRTEMSERNDADARKGTSSNLP